VVKLSGASRKGRAWAAREQTGGTLGGSTRGGQAARRSARRWDSFSGKCGRKAEALLREPAWGQIIPWPADTPLWLVSIPGRLKLMSSRFDSKPSEPIARKTCFAEPQVSRLQPHAAAHPPGTVIHRINQFWREVRLLFPASRPVRRSVAVLTQACNLSGGGPTTRLTSVSATAHGTFYNFAKYNALLPTNAITFLSRHPVNTFFHFLASASDCQFGSGNEQSSKDFPHEFAVSLVAFEHGLTGRHGTLDLNPALVADIVQRGAHLVEIHVTLSEQ
jgi:hypothetical protein